MAIDLVDLFFTTLRAALSWWVPYVHAAAGCAVVTFMWVSDRRAQAKLPRHPSPFCVRCGYAVDGLTACPECALATSGSPLDARPSRRVLSQLAATALLPILGGALTFVPGLACCVTHAGLLMIYVAQASPWVWAFVVATFFCQILHGYAVLDRAPGHHLSLVLALATSLWWTAWLAAVHGIAVALDGL